VTSIRGARIALGVTGGIAAYKAADLASKLVQAGALLDVILTDAATRFVGPATFEAITQRAVHITVFESWRGDWHGHVSLGELADLFVIAPATAGTLARMAHGMADDMLGASLLATAAPVVVAPAMEDSMYHHPATQANLDILRSRGVIQVGPERGRLASGDIGDGRMSEPLTIVGAARQALGRSGRLAGRRIVVTAGGTRESLDPIRYIGNRSSGQMGYAVAQAAIDAGGDVTLISGPVCLAPPYGANVSLVESAVDMQQAVAESVRGADALIMSAAVSDFRPAEPSRSKMKKDHLGDAITIDLVLNPDVLGGVDEPDLLKIGFAAETESLVENARKKLAAKSLDLIVANDAEATIGSPRSRATFVHPDGAIESPEEMPKSELAGIIVERVADLLEAPPPRS
jgi:phosphopantothenoylcysteine decarboxylase / phosphopantothenate---cysteine ligase